MLKSRAGQRGASKLSQRICKRSGGLIRDNQAKDGGDTDVDGVGKEVEK